MSLGTSLQPLPKCSEEYIRKLLSENSSDIRRVFQRSDVRRTGNIPLEMAVRGVMNTLTMNPQRDGNAVRSVCTQAADSDGMVNTQQLMASCAQRPSALNSSFMRYRAAGIMDTKIQKVTTGSVKTPLGYNYEGPPFAVTSDADQMTAIIQSFHSSRRAQLEDRLKKFSKDGVWLTHKEFIVAMPHMDKYQVPEYEIVALIQVLDPDRKRGRINIQQFLNLFGTEYMKNKSSRSTIGGNIDGTSNTLQWPASLDDDYDRQRVMHELRQRRAPKLKLRMIKGTRRHPHAAPQPPSASKGPHDEANPCRAHAPRPPNAPPTSRSRPIAT
ncbi:hypothetical protein DIPPA_09369 [Diplonema papillatum]|nr:hypothetical protein DIPPA_09369 [Diplonema papillatum]